MCHFSEKNEKMGKIPSVSLPAWITCPSSAPCFKECYAKRTERYRFQMRDNALDNFDLYQRNPRYYEESITHYCWTKRYFRYHVDGDMPDYDYLLMVVRIAEACPWTFFWLPTKRFEWVNRYLDEHDGVLPANLSITFSAWGVNYMPENPYNLPIFHVRFGDPEKDAAIPEEAFDCANMGVHCDQCFKCWHAKRGEHIVNDKH